ncbi:MAG: tRNA pseudouridine(13) synthase TruD, partial [Myxococcota bacterium]|nr:tRNA pseudouridine(13) synthase TruD [Myxococcota bacterium]
ARSAVQSWIFNHWLQHRVTSGTLTTALKGDLLKRRDTGGLFVCEDPEQDTERLQKGELIVTGPMMGSRPSRSTDVAAEVEAELVSDLGLDLSVFKKMGRAARGTRRPAVAWPFDPDCSRTNEGLDVKFSLDSGVYATVLLELICGSPLASGPGEPPVEEPRS